MFDIKDKYKQIENQKYSFKIYGNIYNFEKTEELKLAFSKSEIINVLLKLSGYFFIYIEDKENNQKYLCNDVFANYRIYYIQKENHIYISDDYLELLEHIETTKFDHNEQIYFKRHRYTTGFTGLHKEIKKLPPASFFTVINGLLEEEIYFSDKYIKFDKCQNDKEYKEKNYQLLKQNLFSIDKSLPTFLFFSGGVDSTYLALVLKEIGINFKALFIKYTPADKDNIVDEQKVLAVAKKLNIKVETIELDIEKTYEKYQDIAFKAHPIDKAFSIAHYYACDILKQKYGKCNIINGQSSDSIYCWSASTKTLGGFIQRYLTISQFINSNLLFRILFTNIAKFLYKYKWNIPFKFKIPYFFKEYLSAILDPYGYLPIRISDEKFKKYNYFLDKLSGEIDKRLHSNIDFVLFYMKFIYLQGTSNIPVVKSAKIYNHNLIMPFLDIRIVLLKMQYQNEYKNLFYPRYVLEKWMKEYFKFDISSINKGKKIDYTREHSENIKKFAKLVKIIYDRWENKLENISK